jgi:DNA mismatch repair protein MutS2
MAEITMTALEFPGLLQLLQQYAVSSGGRQFLAHLKPLTDLALIQAKFEEIQEFQELENQEGPSPLADFPLLSRWLRKAAVPGSLLEATALNEILTVLTLSARVRQYLALGGAAAPRLSDYAQHLKELQDLQAEIRHCISPHHFILDQASPALSRVRRELAQAREHLNRLIKKTFFTAEFQEVIQSPIISQRHGRYVIAVKADYKGAIAGIIHDQSQTRATLFLEPVAIVEYNNNLNLLHNQEKREEETVLRRLTDLVRHASPEIQANLDCLAAIDVLQAKVLFAREYRARPPIFRSQAGLEFRQACHPLLLKRKKESPQGSEVVPVDLHLTEAQRFLIISGANAGGKTVALKTMGLLTLMVQSGIPIPVAEGSVFAPFDQVFADIGDPQDLHQDLSTFSAHLKRALAILTQLQGRALILLDELGTATDPTEGGALALALLAAFQRRGAFGAATTHLPALKSFAARQPGFQNAAVIFDEDTRRPTYRLAYGLAGASNALKMARELGLSAEILAEAESFLDTEEFKAYHLLAEIQAAQQRLTKQEEALDLRHQEVLRQAQELEHLRQQVLQQQKSLEKTWQQKAQTSIHQAEEEFKAILQKLKHREESWGKLRRELSQRARELLADLAVPQATLADLPVFTPGQQVFLPALNLNGEILAAPGRDGRLEIRVRKIKLRVRPEELAPLPGSAGEGQAAVPPSYHLPPETMPSVNLIGLRVEEALPLVDRLLDQALLHGQEKVDIIHGMGTGRLKQAVWQHLKQHRMVKAFHGDLNPGVTIVDLKD